MSAIHTQLLEQTYKEAEEQLQKNNFEPKPSTDISAEIVTCLNLISDNVEFYLGINNVLVTSLVEKAVNKNRDIRLHQAKMVGGYSGRSLDTGYIAPFLKSKKLRSMVESGWLTRSLEQDFPYNLDYRGAIRNKPIKEAFLKVLDYIQNGNGNPVSCLKYYLQKLIVVRENGKVIINPLKDGSKLQIALICKLLEGYFKECNSYGTAKLPVIAVYSIYQCLVKEVKRYEHKSVLPLAHHTSPDFRSKAIGDIQVNNEQGEPFEGVEIKYNKAITHQLIEDAYDKFKIHPVDRYYLLSTEPITSEEMPAIQETINKISNEHGCQVIANGLINSIKYYLRLLENPEDFINKFSKNIEEDSELKTEHKLIWQRLLSELK